MATNTPTDGVIDEVVLNWTDLTGAKTGATSLGSNKFYKGTIELKNGVYNVTFNYGRVGQSGQTQQLKCKTLNEAKKQLDDKINAKVAKGYTRIQVRTEAEERTKSAAHDPKAAAAAPKAKVKRTVDIHTEVEDLLKTIYGSTHAAVASGLSSSAGASEAAPLGNLSDTQLDKGADILDEIEKTLKGKPKKNDLIDLTNDFLSNIPRNIDHARKGGKLDLSKIVIDSEQRITEQRQFITLLRDAYLQKDVFAQAAKVDDPIEVWLDGLKCNISHLAPKSDEFDHIKKLFDKGQSPVNSNFFGKLKMTRAWSVEQIGRKSAFDTYAASITKKPKASGVIPAWHGTKTENLMGICKTGLVLPKNLPKGVHITGRTFGLGIYHTPCWPDSGDGTTVDEKGKKFTRYNGALKSMNYSSLRGAHYHQDNTADRGYMFLEEVALGVPELALKVCWNKPKPEAGCDYIYARAHGHESLANDEIVTFDENASRRVAIIEVMHKK